MTDNKVDILVSFEDIQYLPKEAEGLENGLHIGKDIWHEFFSVIIGRKKSYLLYQDNVLKGYCHSGSFGLEVVRSLIASQLKRDRPYRITVKQLDKMVKVYLYEISEGRVWNSEYTVSKFRLEEVPKIELKRRSDE